MDKEKDMRTIISHPKAAGRPSDKNYLFIMKINLEVLRTAFTNS